MNKKLILPIVLLSLLVVGMVTAGVVQFFGQRTTTINVELPIDVEGDTTNDLSGIGGGQVEGSELNIVNEADFNIDVEITSSNVGGVETTHIGKLSLAQKVVNFGADKWELLGGLTATVDYAIDGETFTAEVTEGAIEGYELIYYKDNSDRYNSPATAIAIEDVEGNIPYEDDKNADEYNYCETEEYKTCNGGKIWYVPSDAVTDGEIDWGRADEFLFETALIQHNEDGVITMYPNSELEFYPLFNLDLMLDGEVIITTTVDIAEV